MHQTVITSPKKNNGDQSHPIKTVMIEEIIIKGTPAGCIGTKTLFLIESTVDI